MFSRRPEQFVGKLHLIQSRRARGDAMMRRAGLIFMAVVCRVLPAVA